MLKNVIKSANAFYDNSKNGFKEEIKRLLIALILKILMKE